MSKRDVRDWAYRQFKQEGPRELWPGWLRLAVVIGGVLACAAIWAQVQ